MSGARITDRLDVVGLDGTEYDEENVERLTTVKGTFLEQATDVLGALGWDDVDVSVVQKPDKPDVNPMLAIEPSTDGSVLADKQAAIVIAPKVADDTADS
jgi:hypothetical protein